MPHLKKSHTAAKWRLSAMILIKIGVQILWLIFEASSRGYGVCLQLNNFTIANNSVNSGESLVRVKDSTVTAEESNTYSARGDKDQAFTRRNYNGSRRGCVFGEKRKLTKIVRSGTGDDQTKLITTEAVLPLLTSGSREEDSGQRFLNTRTEWSKMIAVGRGEHVVSGLASIGPGCKWRLVRKKKMKRIELALSDVAPSGVVESRFPGIFAEFEDFLLCRGKLVISAWCAAQLLLTSAPFVLGVLHQRPLLLLPHIALDAFLLLIFVIAGVTHLIFIIVLYMAVGGLQWGLIFRALLLSFGALSAFILHGTVFIAMLKWADSMLGNYALLSGQLLKVPVIFY